MNYLERESVFMRHVVRFGVCLLLLLPLLYTFSGCEQSPAQADISSVNMNDITLSAADLAKHMLDTLTFDDALVPVEPAVAEHIYYVAGKYTDIAAYSSTGATAEAILVLRCESASAAETAAASVEKYRTEMADVYAGYNKKESGKLTDALLACDGRYVVFCVSPDTAAARDAYHAFVVAQAQK